MKPPRKVKVGYRDWAISLRPAAEMDELSAMGMCRKAEGEIWLSDGMEPQIMAETLTHELLHAVWYTMNLGTKAPEETAVTSLATGWAGLIRDNPDVLAFISKGLGRR